jgi:hypothetical protein
MKKSIITCIALTASIGTAEAQALISCGDFASGVNAALMAGGKTPLRWEPTRTVSGFSNTNPDAGIKIAIMCNDDGRKAHRIGSFCS